MAKKAVKKSRKVNSSKGARSLLGVDKYLLRAIIGIGLLLVVVSIAYSTAVVLIGVNSTESRIALAPQVIFALLISVYGLYKAVRLIFGFVKK